MDLSKLHDDLSKLNDNQLAELWHTAHNSLETMEKMLQDHPPYAMAKAAIEAIKTIATQRLEASGANSIATPSGTIHTVTKTTARIMDPESFRRWVVDNGAWEMLDWKANMTACRNFVEDQGAPVPGVELSSFRRLSITAPKAPLKRLDDVE